MFPPKVWASKQYLSKLLNYPVCPLSYRWYRWLKARGKSFGDSVLGQLLTWLLTSCWPLANYLNSESLSFLTPRLNGNYDSADLVGLHVENLA